MLTLLTDPQARSMLGGAEAELAAQERELARVLRIEEEEARVLEDIEREIVELAQVAGVKRPQTAGVVGQPSRLCGILGSLTGSIQRKIKEEEGRTQRWCYTHISACWIRRFED